MASPSSGAEVDATWAEGASPSAAPQMAAAARSGKPGKPGAKAQPLAAPVSMSRIDLQVVDENDYWEPDNMEAEPDMTAEEKAKMFEERAATLRSQADLFEKRANSIRFDVDIDEVSEEQRARTRISTKFPIPSGELERAREAEKKKRMVIGAIVCLVLVGTLVAIVLAGGDDKEGANAAGRFV